MSKDHRTAMLLRATSSSRQRIQSGNSPPILIFCPEITRMTGPIPKSGSHSMLFKLRLPNSISTATAKCVKIASPMLEPLPKWGAREIRT